VGEAYTADPLVYHGPFKRPMLEAMRDAFAAVEDGPGFGDVPTLYLHGEDDPLVPISITRPAVERLRGSDFTERVYAGAKHEIFNEIDRQETIDEVRAFADRVA
jgi:alpha-beta hydrolase superfamily lysophospholipase